MIQNDHPSNGAPPLLTYSRRCAPAVTRADTETAGRSHRPEQREARHGKPVHQAE